jgi:hypothetical protein
MEDSQGLAERLAGAAADIEALRADVAAGQPWPLSPAYGEEPESSWGPKEVLAHVAEMLPYWLHEVETILATPPGGPAPAFGRVATDPGRIGRIGDDRHLAVDELFDRIGRGAADVGARLATLTPEERSRTGVHVRLGEMRVPAIFDRFVVSHLEDHVGQLRGVVGRA